MVTASGEGVRDRLRAAVLEGDRDSAVAIARTALETGEATLPELHDALSELLTAVGAQWREGSTAVWQEHLASAVSRTVIEALSPLVRAAAAPPIGRTVLLACPENESHDLGLRMLADRFVVQGWDVVYLGADTPSVEIAAAARARSADLIVLSVSTHFHRVRLRGVLETLGSQLPHTRVLVGGPALCGDAAADAAGHVFDPIEFFGDTSGVAPACEEE